MKKNLQLTIRDDEKKKKEELELSINRKRNKLHRLQTKYASLQNDLNIIQQEYENRIGKLYAKDNALDLEIIRLKNIEKLVSEGLPYEEAAHEIEDLYNTFFKFTPDEDEYYASNYREYNANTSNTMSEKVEQNLKLLWKKLLFQFHPDLVTSVAEKQRREDIMKKINKAYKNKNYEALKMLESQYYIDEFKSGSTEQLEYVLVEIENVIVILEKQLRRLRTSEWYGWKQRLEKAEKSQFDIFAELEKSLLDDIISKTKIVNNLKNNFHPNQTEY